MQKTLKERWFPFSTYPLSDLQHKKIFCFHHAGGTASVYRKWTFEKQDLNFVCVELPGKGTRRKEPFVSDFSQMIEQICQCIVNVTADQPFLLFGHSMGAAMAFYVASYLQEHFGKIPERLIAAGRQAPQDEDPDEFKSYMSDEALIKELEKYNATPKEIFESKEMRSYVLKEVRKDYQLNESLVYHGECIDAPIWINCGKEDRSATFEIMQNWSAVTSKGIRPQEFDGDHFFVLHSEQYSNYIASAG